MKKNYLYFAALGLTAALMAAGCGTGSGESSVSTSVSISEIPVTEGDSNATTASGSESSTSTETVVSASEDIEEDIMDIAQIYMDFVQDEGTLTVKCKSDYLEEGAVLSFEEMYTEFGNGLTAEGMPGNTMEAYYSFLDCGLDGNSELAVKIVYKDEENYNGPVEEMFIIKYMDDGLCLISVKESYYRTYSDINCAGVGSTGGSSGANSYGYNEWYINADGEEEFLYYAETESRFARAIIPYYLLPGEVPDDYPQMDGFAESDYYDFNIYNFSEYTSEEYSEESYNEYKKGFFFRVADELGNDAEFDPDYQYYYDQIGIKSYTQDEIDTMLHDHMAELGVTDDILTANPIEWTQLWCG